MKITCHMIMSVDGRLLSEILESSLQRLLQCHRGL